MRFVLRKRAHDLVNVSEQIVRLKAGFSGHAADELLRSRNQTFTFQGSPAYCVRVGGQKSTSCFVIAGFVVWGEEVLF